jgi:hypothetical protein
LRATREFEKDKDPASARGDGHAGLEGPKLAEVLRQTDQPNPVVQQRIERRRRAIDRSVVDDDDLGVLATLIEEAACFTDRLADEADSVVHRNDQRHHGRRLRVSGWVAV